MQEDNNSSESTNEVKKDNKNLMLIVAVVVILLLALGGAYMVLSTRSSTSQNTTTETQQPTQADSMEDQMMEDEETATDSADDESMMMEGEAEMEADVEAMAEEGVREITVNGFSYGYNPSTLTMEAGESVRLTFVSEDAIHDFIVEGTDIATETVPGGEETTIEFTAPEEPGTYTYYCSVGNHRALGMEGTLVVN